MAAQYFMDVKNGKRTVEYLHSDLEPILSPYNGVFVYQEEVMKFLVDIVGYTWEESDIIRGAIAKKKSEVIMNTFKKIRESCYKRGWSEESIETICQQIQAFSRYSFNKSHSHAYAELGYITLFLKHHYKLEWWTSVLNNEDKDDKVRKYIAYLGDVIGAPSAKNPQQIFTIQDGKIIAPVSAIKSVGPAVVNELISKGPFQSIEDYVDRVNHSRVNIGSFSALIKARAVDEMMDQTIPDYIERRKALMTKYLGLRKSKTEFKEDMWDLDPIKIFLQEKEYNSSFNRNLLSDKEIGKILMSKWPALEATPSQSIPYKMKSTEEDREDCFILSSVKVAENSLKRKVNKNFGMILLYEGSTYKSGVSKSGRTWHKVSAMLSDGYNTIEAVKWDQKKAFGWPKNTIVYVSGELKEGWRTPVSITIDEIDKVE